MKKRKKREEVYCEAFSPSPATGGGKGRSGRLLSIGGGSAIRGEKKGKKEAYSGKGNFFFLPGGGREVGPIYLREGPFLIWEEGEGGEEEDPCFRRNGRSHYSGSRL